MNKKHDAYSLPIFHKGPTDWMDHAACRNHDREIFFTAAGVTTAQAICARCPVQADCHRYAHTDPVETEGVWGGIDMTNSKRKARR